MVITGLGAVTPLGTGVGASWNALRQGKSGVALVAGFDCTGFRTTIAAEVRDFNPEDFISHKLARTTDRFIHFALAASIEALKDSGLVINSDNHDRVGVIVGTAVGGMATGEKIHRLILENKARLVSPFFAPTLLCNMAAGQIAILLGAHGPNLCTVTACAAGTQSIGQAFRIIQNNEADVMLAGGAEAPLTKTIFGGLDALRAMSSRNNEPARASRPFDKGRDGFVLGEGAGILVLEALDQAEERGARIHAEVVGYNSNCNAYHITSPEPDGRSMAECMRLALKDASVSPETVDYINAHGTSTVINDLAETKAIKSVFGEHSRKVAVSSIKSMIGHLWGAAGALQAVVSCLAINQGVIPPTINLENPDPECDLDYVPKTARKQPVNTVLINSFGFGGTNGCLVIKKF